MRIRKSLLLSLAFLPFVSVASPMSDDLTEQDFRASDRFYNDVPLLCYAGFRAVIDLLPELTHQLNMNAGKEVLVIDNVVTPVGYNTVFEWDVIKPMPKHTALAQTYTPGADANSGTLYLNFLTATPPPNVMSKIWGIFDKVMIGCAENVPDLEPPTIPGIPG